MKTYSQFIFEITIIPKGDSYSRQKTVSFIHHPRGVFSYPKYAHHYKVAADNDLDGFRGDGSRHEGFASVKPGGKIDVRHYNRNKPPEGVMNDVEKHLEGTYKLNKKHTFTHKSAYDNW
jgi:hypothetical protein